MSKSGAMVPAKPLDLPAAMARADDLLRLWSPDFDLLPPDEARAVCLAAIQAIQTGEENRLAVAMLAPCRRRDLVVELDELIAAFPGMRKDVDLTTFSRVLAEEVSALSPSHAAVHGGCRALIRSATFPPTIAEVVASVAAHQATCAARAALLARLPRRAAEAAAALGTARGAP